MKKVVLLATLLFATIGFSQEKFNTYNSEYLSKDYQIDISKSKKGIITFWIDVASMDTSTKKISLRIEESKLQKFKDVLLKYKSKYSEWSKVALENNVTELKKAIDIKGATIAAAFLNYSDWQFDYSTTTKARFLILDGKHLLLIENKYKLQSSSNQFTDCDGYILAFSNESEIDEFISLLDLPKAKEQLNKKTDKESLFN